MKIRIQVTHKCPRCKKNFKGNPLKHKCKVRFNKPGQKAIQDMQKEWNINLK